jgi:hypothetical protein
MKRIGIIVVIILALGTGFYYLNKPVKEKSEESVCTLNCYIFLEDFSVKQAKYDGGDFPSGSINTYYKKGQIVEGREGLNGCQGEGCVPEKIIIINVNGQNWPVSKSILVPYK